jgi:hypothetical protein
MANINKTTAQITIQHWTQIQMRMSGAAQFTDALPLDDVSGSGTGPFLVMEHGIWKYPQQAVGGRFKIPSGTGKPVRLVGVLADFGAVTAYTISICGIDNSAARPDNISNTPYTAARAPLYRELDVQIASGNTRYLATNFNVSANDKYAVLAPGQDIVVTTAAGVEPMIRMTFGLCSENY